MDQRLPQRLLATPDSIEPHASAWQGLMDSDDPQQALATAHWDKLLNAVLGTATASISPAAVGLALMDWQVHLAMSPSRRELLVIKAWKKYRRWLTLAQQASPGACCIEPLPQDKRFADPAWQRWSYNILYQGFLLHQQWWHVATTGVPGMSQHHEDVVSFRTRQLLDMAAPSNFILTNPVVRDETMRRGGMNLVHGFVRLCTDLAAQFNHAGAANASPACADSGANKLNMAGYCLGGTLLALTAAAMARDGDARIGSIILFASQVDFKEPGELSLFIDDNEVSYLEASMWNRGYLDPTQMAGAFQLLRSNDLIWSRRLRNYLLDLPEQHSDLMAWNADATLMPYRMHSQYLRSLFLHNDLSEGRYCVEGRPVARSDIRVPVFCVATLTDHVAPWRSVFKLHRLLHTQVDFLLTSGGHNVGVVSPPDDSGRHFQLARHSPAQPAVDPDTWSAKTPLEHGSWWPAWISWLEQRSGAGTAPYPFGAVLCDAPGTYVHQR